MNKIETAKILAVLKTAYPAFYKDSDIDSAVNLWATMFADAPAQIVTESVKSLLCTLKFPPTIADVKEKISLITQPQAMTEMEAWGLVLKALQDSSYHAKERFDELPKTIQKVVGSHNMLKEWGQMPTETVNSVVQSNFMRSYTARVKADKEINMLPDSTKAMIAGLSERMMLE